jgi:stage IV sporulation protein FB
MLLTEPPPSQGDLHFRLFGIPVRVHPFFWVVTVIMGLQGAGEGGTPPAQLFGWIAIVFVSILVHELGHAFLQRRFGGRPWITLHGFGGLASCDDCDSSPRSQILIALAGPVAGFCLAAVVVAGLRLSDHAVGWTSASNTLPGMVPISLLGVTLYFEPLASQTGTIFVFYMLWVNIVWGLVNLLPVYPLDGGRISRELCTLNHPRRGIVLSLQISIGVAIAMAIFGLLAWRSVLIALMFGYFAYTNYQTLQSYQQNRW